MIEVESYKHIDYEGRTANAEAEKPDLTQQKELFSTEPEPEKEVMSNRPQIYITGK